MPRVLMVGVDGSADSVAAMHWTIQRAAVLCALVRVVHVAPARGGGLLRKPHRSQEENSTRQAIGAEELLNETPRRADGVSVIVEHEVVDGKPGSMLATLTHEPQNLVDLLVVGAVGQDRHSFACPPSPGPTARHVMRHAACPVAVIRHAHVFGEPHRATTAGRRAPRLATSGSSTPAAREPAPT